MVIRINNPTQLEMQFKEYDRDYFSYEGYTTLLDWFDDLNPDYELDVIGICEDWTEYGPDIDGSYEVFTQDWDYKLPEEEWVRDTYEEYEDADDDEIDLAIDNNEIDIDDYYEALADALSMDTEVIPLENGDYLVEAF